MTAVKDARHAHPRRQRGYEHEEEIIVENAAVLHVVEWDETLVVLLFRVSGCLGLSAVAGEVEKKHITGAYVAGQPQHVLDDVVAGGHAAEAGERRVVDEDAALANREGDLLQRAQHRANIVDAATQCVAHTRVVDSDEKRTDTAAGVRHRGTVRNDGPHCVNEPPSGINVDPFGPVNQEKTVREHRDQTGDGPYPPNIKKVCHYDFVLFLFLVFRL